MDELEKRIWKELNEKFSKEMSNSFREEMEKMRNRIQGVVLMILGGALLVMIWIAVFTIWQEIPEEDTVEISSIIAKPITRVAKRGRGDVYVFVLEKYPSARFVIKSSPYNSIKNKKQLVRNVKRGHEFKMKIKRKIYQKIPNYKEEIKIFAIRDTDNNYLQLEDYNRALKRDTDTVVPILIAFCLLVFFAGLYTFLKNKAT